ncbi:hypothetical protein FVR03_01605 [Pontibacter qinzhouensis]|uniref:Lipoprotein n=1 Tax=Pontibacter qinzhouensis TaxID=2603253 RepID=A0A5C8KDH6_9BACT|nr:hypothetical protein [Pontibacter qinzhouensis]TXK52143.1 hypothetical protein FVR03_01605 [Pontibacter qinzhouensis]
MKTNLFKIPRGFFWCMLLLLLGCNRDEEATETFIQKVDGEPYKGTASIQVNTGKGPGNTIEGTTSFQLMDVKGDSATIAITTKLPNNNTLNLKIKGKQDGQAWQSGEKELTFHVSAQGIISGETTTPQEKFKFDGSLSETNLVLKTHIVQLVQVDEFPAGTELMIMHNAQRELKQGGNGSSGGCNLVLRPISTPTGLVMGMVPECD